jgi:hypothetical protein
MLLVVGLASCSRCHSDHPKPQNHTVNEPPRPTGPQSITVDDYEHEVYKEGPQASFLPTTAAEREMIQKLVPKLLEGSRTEPPPDPSQWRPDAQAAGFDIVVWNLYGETFWALLEKPGTVHGAGAYIFRVGPKETGKTILLEAPHNFFDLGTGRIAAEVFFRPPPGEKPRALFTNTIHRYQLSPGNKKRRKDHPADVAHNPDHAFSFATEAFATAAGGARVIQLHGFGERDDVTGERIVSIEMVVSAGDEAKPSLASSSIATTLAKDFGPGVKTYPDQTKYLGATTNAQKKLLANIPNCEFVHVEMSADLRERLQKSAEAREMLARDIFNAP